MASKCAHEESRLTCTDCGKPICASCLVQCPVGFRCKPCAAPTKTHQAAGTTKAIFKMIGACSLLGFVGGLIMPFVQIPLFSIFICYLMGSFGGRWLLQFVDYRIGSNTTKITVFGLLLGMFFSCLNGYPLAAFWAIAYSVMNAGAGIFDVLTRAICQLVCPLAFIFGVLRSIR